MPRRVLIAVVAVSLAVIAAPTAAQARQCPSASVGGASVGDVTLDGKRVPIKVVHYPAGGVLDPPASAAVVGISARHRALLSKSGTTVLTWHVRFGAGCDGALNHLMDKPIGSTFTLSDVKGRSREYAISERHSVPKGEYDPAWFRVTGDPQVLLFTCTGLKNGKYRKTMAIIAMPV